MVSHDLVSDIVHKYVDNSMLDISVFGVFHVCSQAVSILVVAETFTAGTGSLAEVVTTFGTASTSRFCECGIVAGSGCRTLLSLFSLRSTLLKEVLSDLVSEPRLSSQSPGDCSTARLLLQIELVEQESVYQNEMLQ